MKNDKSKVTLEYRQLSGQPTYVIAKLVNTARVSIHECDKPRKEFRMNDNMTQPEVDHLCAAGNYDVTIQPAKG